MDYKVPKAIQSSQQVNKVEVEVTNVLLHKSCEVVVYLKNDQRVVKVERFPMGVNDYQRWSSDDNFVVDWALDKLNNKYPGMNWKSPY